MLTKIAGRTQLALALSKNFVFCFAIFSETFGKRVHAESIMSILSEVTVVLRAIALISNLRGPREDGLT